VGIRRKIMEKELHCFDNDYDTVVAYSKEDAQIVYHEYIGSSKMDECEIDDWDQISDDAVLKIDVEGNYNLEDVVSKTAREWILENGRGFLCSTEY
jgi:hypothetical protein